MQLHTRHLPDDRIGKIRERCVTAEACESLQLLRVRRQALCLFIGDHLQPMFDGAQEGVSRRQVVHCILRDPAIGGQTHQHVQRARATQLRTPSAKNQLLCLDEELDLANAAASELHIMSRDSDFRMAAHGMDLPLHRVDVGNGRIIEIFAPDEGRELVQECHPQRAVARDRPRLDQRRALPVLAEIFIIGESRRQ